MSDKQSAPPTEPVLYLPQRSPYDVLGLTPQATTDEIKAAYFALVRQYSPERDAARFKEIRAAYDRLKTLATRLETDMRLWQHVDAPPMPAVADLALGVRDEDRLFLLVASSDLALRDMSKQFREVRL